MPHTSPYLDSLLIRWTAQGTDLRKEAAFQKDLLEPLALAAHGNRLAMRERRRRDLRHLEESLQDARTRWDERLHRIEEWKRNVDGLQQEEECLRQLIQSSLWLQKARQHQDAFTRHLEHRASLLDGDQQALHDKLAVWQTALQNRIETLQELNEKNQNAVRPFYVSRARKQPEAEFVGVQQTVGETLGRELQGLRRSLSIAWGRLQKAVQAVDRQASGAEILYEVHKQELVGALKSSQKILEQRRDAILSDALLYEGCRNRLHRLQDIVNGLRCIEDIPKRRYRSSNLSTIKK